MPSRYELNTSSLFLTYPQCPVDKQEALDFFIHLLAPREYVVAHERHANGDHHLHCYFKLDAAFRTKDPKALDIIQADGTRYHGNYQGCRSNKAVLKYCTKAEDFLSNIDVSGMLSSKSNRTILGKRLLDGEQLVDIIREVPSLIFGLSRLEQDLSRLKELTSEALDLPDKFDNPWGLKMDYESDRKQRHYWIYSHEPNRGKTTFAKLLRDTQRAVIQSGDFTYWNVTAQTRILVLDDYNVARLKYDNLNQICDGTFGFRVFQRGVVVLDEFIIFVLSNKSIFEMYPEGSRLLSARFIEYCIDEVSE